MYIQGNGGHASVVKDLLDVHPLEFDDTYAVIAVGDNEDRRKEAVRLAAFTFPALVHPSATISALASLGKGTVVMAGAVVQAEAVIGEFVILNTACTVDHGCRIGDFAHIAPGVHLCGNVEVGEGALVGVGSCATPGSKIKPWSVVKAGSVCLTK